MADANLIFTADAHEAGAVMTVKDINLNETDITIRLMGTDSKAWREIVAERDRAIVSGESTGGMSDEELVALLTLGWEKMPNPNGEGLLEFSKENAVMVYQKAPFLFEQANRFAAKRVNFIPT